MFPTRPTTTPVQRFVAATNAHDGDALLALFAPGATVIDDGTTSSAITRLSIALA
ncbi:hypothetical protein N1028_19475 [Herbiconiux sp. CPCC 203407]|uniref:SnoaL-like domain-containing protein n=1 Tax=Herbiconiux oxytropis TaxID=2970915 RepID=A0AA41XK11_9MICO|nr:hypothetical protein [Herbiconiux oxytropis]MCS5723676.1 hypothetical protein [Herbiconiux oxytropis]MCS5728085.1 hypothetical protein [Herbiconiux oxytropis]